MILNLDGTCHLATRLKYCGLFGKEFLGSIVCGCTEFFIGIFDFSPSIGESSASASILSSE